MGNRIDDDDIGYSKFHLLRKRRYNAFFHGDGLCTSRTTGNYCCLYNILIRFTGIFLTLFSSYVLNKRIMSKNAAYTRIAAGGR